MQSCLSYESLPDILEELELFAARTALLFTLGYAGLLREDGSLPNTELDEDVNRLLSVLASQPVAKQTRGPLILHRKEFQFLSATILGMVVEITFEGSDQLTVVAEAILGSLEAFFATAIDHRVIPHTERFRISLIADATVSEPTIKTSALDMSAVVEWPTTLVMTSF